MFLETILDDLYIETFLLFIENCMKLKCQILLLSQTLFVKLNKYQRVRWIYFDICLFLFIFLSDLSWLCWYIFFSVAWKVKQRLRWIYFSFLFVLVYFYWNSTKKRTNKNKQKWTIYLTFWQCGLLSFQVGGTKLERFLPKNQLTQRKILNFENWCNGEVSKSAKFDFRSQFCIPRLNTQQPVLPYSAYSLIFDK